jgi:hypothetical protein
MPRLTPERFAVGLLAGTLLLSLNEALVNLLDDWQAASD